MQKRAPTFSGTPGVGFFYYEIYNIPLKSSDTRENRRPNTDPGKNRSREIQIPGKTDPGKNRSRKNRSRESRTLSRVGFFYYEIYNIPLKSPDTREKQETKIQNPETQEIRDFCVGLGI